MVQRIMGDVWKQSLFKLGGKLKEFKNHLGWLADTASNVLYYRLASWRAILQLLSDRSLFGQSFIEWNDRRFMTPSILRNLICLLSFAYVEMNKL